MARPATAIPAWTGQARPPTRGRVLEGEAEPEEVAQLAAALPADRWTRRTIKERSQGPLRRRFFAKLAPNHALDAVTVGIEKRHINWVLDVDIRGVYEAIDHEWLVKFVEHRIGGQRIIRHIHKWLKAGVLEDGQWRDQEAGTPPGGSAVHC